MYQPTIRSVKNHYSRLNKKIFHGFLPSSKQVSFGLDTYIECWGHCELLEGGKSFKITVDTCFPSKELFLDILVHEMVHIAEYLTYECMSHGETFYKFKPLVDRFGYSLQKKY